jgi:transposase
MTRGLIILNQEEQRRVMVLTKVLEGTLLGQDAAQLLGVSVRHCRRVLAAFRQDGPAALAHGNRGRPPHNRLPARVRRRVLRLAKTIYAGFNDHHLTELLREEQVLHVSRPTVSRWLRDAGLPSPHTRRPPRHRRRRERMPQEGLLVQCDASHHDWLEDRGPPLVLHGIIDDATNKVPAAIFREEEDAFGYFGILRDVVTTHGRPVALYSDRHGIFHRDPRQPPTLAQQLRGLRRPPTQFGRALQELGIRWIPASSPQAKGRIERLWGILQDRLGSELRRARARSLDDANAVLARFLPRYNARFAQTPADPHAAYRPLTSTHRLDDICCFAYARTVANDNTIQLGEHLIQILPGPRRQSYARARVIVREHLDGTLSVSYKDQRLRSQRLSVSSPAPRKTPRARTYERLLPGAAPRQRRTTAARPTRRGPTPYRPPADHPWRRPGKGVRRRLLQKAEVTSLLNR